MIVKVKNILGYLNNFSEMRKAKIENTLKKLYNLDGVIIYSYEFVINRILDNHKPEKVENYSYYSSRIDGHTKPKTLYKLQDNKGCYNEINKTQYDFALWLIKNNLTTKDSIKDFEQKEADRIDKIKEIELRKEKYEKEKEIQEQQKKVEFENWLLNESKTYNDIEKIELAKNIYMDIISQYDFNYIKKVLTLIDNYNKEECKQYLIENILHLHNKASRKVFECITGIKLPKTQKSTIELLNNITSKDFTKPIEYNKKIVKEKVLSKFYKRNFMTGEVVNSEGERIELKNFILFAVKENGIYNFYELKSGMRLTQGTSNKAESIKNINSRLNDIMIEKLNNEINKIINKYGEELKEII